MIDNEKKWLAAHLYYSEPWHELLVNSIKPLTENIISSGQADQFFFLRYWDRGPHIRLRFKGDPEILENKVKPLLIDHFEKYFEKFPSERKDPVHQEAVGESEKWFPNNTIQFIEYEPEAERYGGPVAITVAEEQFEASSKAILSIIKNSVDSWDYDHALGAAIQMHLGFGYGLGMDLRELHAFFSIIFSGWLPRAYHSFESNIDAQELDRRKEETLLAFKENFTAQKDTILPFVQTIWNAMNSGQEFEQEWLNNWIHDMEEVRDQLISIQSEYALVVPKRPNRTPHPDFSMTQQDRWLIYDSYVHMTNNRLGILNRDEGYLGYLIKECIATMLDTTQTTLTGSIE